MSNGCTSRRVLRHGFSWPLQCALSPPPYRRNVSTEARVREEMVSRKPNVIYDYLSPTPSYLLNISLSDFLPPSCYPPNYNAFNNALPLARHNISRYSDHQILPQGHHLVYFVPQVSSSALLPDGTDPIQSPGPPFVRRLWAGGSLKFNIFQEYQPELHGTRAACVERIVNVTTKGLEGDEEVYVKVERRIGPVESAWDFEEKEIDDVDILQRFRGKANDEVGEASLVETRNIVFMRERTQTAAAKDVARKNKMLKPTKIPDYSLSLVPTQSLLFRFSALTFNAHGIHLDPEYCRKIEGHKHLLVHGPLTLVLMFSVLRSQLKQDEMVESFEYRNLAPLYADEELKVCVRKDMQKELKWDVWIEGSKGGYAVKGSATIGHLSS